jgi:hypothetical protein
MSTAPWTDAFLDSMRLKGDEPADRAVEALFARHDLRSVQRLMDQLVRNDDVPHSDLPAEIQQYLDGTPDVPAPARAVVVAGQRLFAEYGPEISMVLACGSLPAAYASRKGVQVLYRSGYLADRANRRVAQTGQMVVDVLTPGGLDPGGRGRRAAQKVRLMHAAIRYLILHDTDRPWAEEYGIPINQEDLAGTLMTFTSAILQGLALLKIELTAEQSQSYLEAWRAVARMMGIVDELIPTTVAEAHLLCDIISRRQTEPCAEGRAMTTALLDMMKAHLLPPFQRMPAAMMRYLLPPGVADGLGIPEEALERELIKAGVDVGRAVDRLTGGAQRRKLFRTFSIQLLQVLAFAECGGRRTQFHIPTELRDSWQLAAQ